MMEDVNTTVNPQSPTTAPTPGAILREARLAKKMGADGVTKIAKQLHLSEQWIKDLENDDYSRAPALIYIRGYLRAYARFLEISPEAVIAAFEAHGFAEAFTRHKAADDKIIKHQAVPIVSQSKRIIISRRMVHWISVSATGVFVVLLGVWWQGQKKHDIDPHVASPVVMQQPKEELPIKSTVVTSDEQSLPKPAAHPSAPCKKPTPDNFLRYLSR